MGTAGRRNHPPMRAWIILHWHATMNRITRYILRQLALSTLLVVVTLTAAIWLTSRAPPTPR